MNGTCTGGTGAFIDQMTAFFQKDAEYLNKLGKDWKTVYPIAGRCGVFAKTDIQTLINEGALQEKILQLVYIKQLLIKQLEV
jgi:activator of 2-hydroxyglutaryl-CoA dehydratase